MMQTITVRPRDGETVMNPNTREIIEGATEVFKSPAIMIMLKNGVLLQGGSSSRVAVPFFRGK